MKFSFTASTALSQKQPAAVLFAFEKEHLIGPAAFRNLLARIGPKEFRGKEPQLLLLHTAGKLAPQRILLVGLGSRDSFTSETMRRAMGLATRKLRDSGIERAAVQISEGHGDDSLGAIVEA